jgi:hypothetical protein
MAVLVNVQEYVDMFNRVLDKELLGGDAEANSAGATLPRGCLTSFLFAKSACHSSILLDQGAQETVDSSHQRNHVFTPSSSIFVLHTHFARRCF